MIPYGRRRSVKFEISPREEPCTPLTAESLPSSSSSSEASGPCCPLSALVCECDGDTGTLNSSAPRSVSTGCCSCCCECCCCCGSFPLSSTVAEFSTRMTTLSTDGAGVVAGFGLSLLRGTASSWLSTFLSLLSLSFIVCNRMRRLFKKALGKDRLLQFAFPVLDPFFFIFSAFPHFSSPFLPFYPFHVLPFPSRIFPFHTLKSVGSVSKAIEPIVWSIMTRLTLCVYIVMDRE